MTALLTRILLGGMAMLPRRLAQRLGSLLGWCNARFNTRSAAVTRANLALCCPETEDCEAWVKRSLIETAKTLMETPAVWMSDPQRTDQWIAEIEQEADLLQALRSDKGVLLILPHCGNWELLNVFFRRYGRMTALYQPPRQPALRPIMAEVRARSGNEMVATDRQGIAALYRRLKTGGTVVVLPDQVPASGTYAPFFGQMALTDELSVRLVRKTGAQALGIALLRKPDGLFRVVVKKPGPEFFSDEMPVALAGLNALVESLARIELDQYQWEYKRFRERPAGEEKIYRFGRPPALHR
ncbi:MAG: lysophospholipid acyltransferase family protein [Proteobacteria bacterium]|jgi:KDO2-lipid IV(A) lauroyltransferase|nr:lysophospholipid acyltransferase family protein [Pseudomonadota bacterium]